MKLHKAISVLLGLSLIGCAGGGIDAISNSSGDTSSDALVQLVEYETFRNLMISALELQTNGSAVQFLDQNKVLFGGQLADGVPRETSANATRLSLTYKFADRACLEAVQNKEKLLFPDGPKGDVIMARLRGRALNDRERDSIESINRLPNWINNEEREQAVCVFSVAGIETSLK